MAIPAGTLQSGENTITIDAISGNGEEGVLSPSIVSTEVGNAMGWDK